MVHCALCIQGTCEVDKVFFAGLGEMLIECLIQVEMCVMNL